MAKPGSAWVLGLLAVSAVAALVAAALWPRPVVVDLASVSRGPMAVILREEGVTRVSESYLVSSPIVGRLRRITLDPGDPVEAGRTVLGVIEPVDPALLDARSRAEARARVRAAEAGALRAGADAETAEARYAFAENELTRIRAAAGAGAASAHEIDAAESEHRTAQAAWRAARFAQEIARFELELARSALEISVASPAAGAGEPPESLVIRAPVSGRVLRVESRSDRVVAPGDPLLEIGDPADLEIVADLLSTQAVRVRPGDRVLVEHWGGDEPLEGVVRLVEPAAFTKVSALGIEEQRVNVVADFVTPPEGRASLGDAYRVEVGIVLWSGEDVLRVPTSAVLRSGDGWAAYRVEAGRARLVPVRIGRQNAEQTEVLGGLGAGDRVVLYPGDRMGDGVRVRASEP
jgi:HlyD family secretion protein